jgi:type IV pilus assembly protein PilZ
MRRSVSRAPSAAKAPPARSGAQGDLSEYQDLNRRRVFGQPALEVVEMERLEELRETLEQRFGVDVVHGSEAERRNSLRLPTHLRVGVGTGDVVRIETAVDISQGGVFISTRHPLPEGSVVVLAFGEKSGAAGLELRGAVSRVLDGNADGDGCGMGVEFGELSAENRDTLDALIAQAATSPGS